MKKAEFKELTVATILGGIIAGTVVFALTAMFGKPFPGKLVLFAVCFMYPCILATGWIAEFWVKIETKKDHIDLKDYLE